jgi:hypothetical protein
MASLAFAREASSGLRRRRISPLKVPNWSVSSDGRRDDVRAEDIKEGFGDLAFLSVVCTKDNSAPLVVGLGRLCRVLSR